MLMVLSENRALAVGESDATNFMMLTTTLTNVS